ncbi:IspG [Acrasis kona]|uniref:IspG n=1 Tax=Acrasis kona TaxID=1008807 RepID=A0AAW2ZSS1_9EUKA
MFVVKMLRVVGKRNYGVHITACRRCYSSVVEHDLLDDSKNKYFHPIIDESKADVTKTYRIIFSNKNPTFFNWTRYATYMNAISMLMVAYVLGKLYRKEDLSEHPELQIAPPAITKKQGIVYVGCTLFTLLVFLGLSVYSKRFIVELGTFDRVGEKGALLRVITPKYFGYRETWVPIHKMESTNYEYVKPIYEKTGKLDYIYLKNRGTTSFMLMDIDAKHSYFNKDLFLEYMSPTRVVHRTVNIQ